MATAPPAMATHQGAMGGMASASSHAASIALPSDSAGVTGRLRNCSATASVASALAQQSNI